MKNRISLLLAMAASALLVSGCYTQVGTMRDEPSRDYSSSNREYDTQSPPPDSGYTENGGYGDNGDYWRYRDRSYYDYYYPPFYNPWAFHAGLVMGGYYSPFFWNPWDPWYPTGGWYYPYSAYPNYGGRYRQGFVYYNGAGGGNGQTRNFGVTRGGSGLMRGAVGGPDYRTSTTVRDVSLPAGGSSRGTSRPSTTTVAPRSTTGRNGGRSGAVDRAGHGRTGGSRESGRSSSPPPPRSGGQSRGNSGGVRYSPPSPPPASTGSAGRSSGSGGGGGSSSGGGGGSRGGSRR